MSIISLSTSKKDVKFTLRGTGSVKVNWGGGVVKDYALNPLSCATVEHDYATVSTPSPLTVTIWGCSRMELTALAFILSYSTNFSAYYFTADNL